MAEHQMELIVERALADYGAHKIILHHRIGFVPVAESSLFLRVMSGHRQAAFGAGQWIVDELKRRVPIWKRPVLLKPTATATTTIARANKLQTAAPSP
jgi:molybdopterin synthase catalytic subunit